MAIFVLIADDGPNPEAIHAAITANFTESIRFGTRTWFVATKGTPQSISQTLGLWPNDPPQFTGLAVLQLAGPYWGRANANIWSWLKEKFERSDG
jgi:hypothetical protein